MHVLRHSAAMRLLRAGIDTSVIALWLGHEQIETTRFTCTPIWNLKSAPWRKQLRQPRRQDATDRPISSSPFLRRSDYADSIATITATEATFPALVGIIWRSA